MELVNYVVCGVAMVVLLTCSGLGIFFPFVGFGGGNKTWRSLLSSVSAGVVLCVAWLHLLDDAQDSLEGLTDFPAANAAMLLGFLVMAACHAFAPCPHNSKEVPLLGSSSVPKDDVACLVDDHSTGSAPPNPRIVTRFHAMEVSISFHSVLIGLAFGFTVAWREQVGLGIALCVHQFFEGMALGTSGRQARLTSREWLRTYIVFCLSLPLGIAAAITLQLLSDVNSTANTTWRWSYGLASAFAAGTLTHIGVEMINHELDVQHHQTECVTPLSGEPSPSAAALLPLLGISAGAAVMAVLAVWA